jgi:hypothetical protein
MTRQLVKAVMLTAAMWAAWLPSAHAQGKLDHLFCYRMKDPLTIRTTVDMLADLQPEFTQKGCRLLKAVEFCVPASKANVNPLPPNPNIVGQPLQDDYICYLAECRNPTQPADKVVADQFGRRIERNYRPVKVCVPARKRPVPCGASGFRQCGGVCPEPGDDCRISPVDAGCACVPRECGGQADAAGACGGACPKPDDRCLPDAKGACECQPPPPPPCDLNSAAGICGGTCANPADQCIIDATGTKCACQPPPTPACGSVSGTTQCGGPCSNATDKCVTDAAGNCKCQPPLSSCGLVPGTNVCGGPCTDRAASCTLSKSASGAVVCTCQPPTPTPTPRRCGRIPGANQCGGPCEGNTGPCRLDTTTGDCTCKPPPPPTRTPTPAPQGCALISGTANQCGGTCPAGTSCQLCTNCAAGPCTCLPPPTPTATAGTVPVACGMHDGQCGGTCQVATQSCKPSSTANTCTCQ